MRMYKHGSHTQRKEAMPVVFFVFFHVFCEVFLLWLKS